MKRVLRACVGYLKKTDKVLFLLCVAASVYGIILIYSATHTTGMREVFVQSGALIAGLLLAIFISTINYEELSEYWLAFGVAAAVLMILTLFIGVGPPGSDNKAWILLPFGLSLQTSEVLKFAFIITFARHIDKVKRDINHPIHVLLLCLHGAVPLLLVLLTKDDGTAMVVAAVFVCMMLASGINLKYILSGVGLSLAAIPIIWNFYMGTFQKNRFLVLFNPDRYDPNREALFFQQNQSQIAIGSGQFSGQGFMEGIRTQNLMVPKNYNDFILSVAGEEFGFIGCSIIFLLLVCVFGKVLMNGRRSHFKMGYLICVGIFAQIAFQAIINIGMCLGLFPVVGVTLPFFSAGGSSLLTLFISIGLAVSVYIHNDDRMVFGRLGYSR